MKVLILNGPNLNLLGKREPGIYGNDSLDGLESDLKSKFPDISFQFYQSNVEGELINKIHEVGFNYDAIIFNPGGYTHTSVAIRDAVSGITTPVIEVHISNTHAREDFRHVSYISSVSSGTIIGFGIKGYELAIRSLF
jgi:3-dehydroquinate dehydratase-2